MPAEHYQAQWYKADEKKWINSGGWHEDKSMDMAKEWLARDQAYFYKHIPLRIVKITIEVVEETTGLQEV